MVESDRRTIQIVSHGPGCLDGVVAAAAVARFYDGHRVLPLFAANGESDRVIQKLRSRGGRGGDEIWITDLSWTSTASAECLGELARAGSRIFWIDHHRTAVSRAGAPEFKVPFAGRVLSEEFSAARLVFNYLKQREDELPSESARQTFDEFFALVAIADDHDRWIHAIQDSPDWALAVQTLGSRESYREIIRLRRPVMTRKLAKALAAGREALGRSRELARATIVDKPVGGLKVRAACCFGYSSEVAADLYQDQQQTVIALFDLRSQGVSLRRSADCTVDLSHLAHSFGGGGHPAAAGFALDELVRLPIERLADILCDKLKTP